MRLRFEIFNKIVFSEGDPWQNDAYSEIQNSMRPKFL